MHVSGNIKGPQLKSFLLDFTQENTYSFRIKTTAPSTSVEALKRKFC